MSDQQQSNEARPMLGKEKTVEKGGTLSAVNSSSVKPTEALTPEEQMALYEKELKENDWGHQPC